MANHTNRLSAITSIEDAEKTLMEVNNHIRHFVDDSAADEKASISLEVFKRGRMAISALALFQGSEFILGLVEIMKSEGWAFDLRTHAMETAVRLVEQEKGLVPLNLVEMLYIDLRCLEMDTNPALSRKASEAIASIRKLGVHRERLEEIDKDSIFSRHIENLKAMKKNGNAPLSALLPWKNDKANQAAVVH